MNRDNERNRRRFLRTALTGAGVIASPWSMRAALAATTTTGRAVIGFPLPPPGLQLLTALLTEIRTRYEPDLGTRPVVLAGASGGLAIETVSRSASDGATVLIAPSTLLTLAPMIQTTAMNPVDALMPVVGIGEARIVFLVGPAVPAQVRTMADYVQWVRANPRSNSYGVPALVSAPGYMGAEISRLAGVPMRAVGYKGLPPLTDDVAAGTIPSAVTVLLGTVNAAKYPQLRVLAVSGERRVPQLPDVPTLHESGFAVEFPTESLGVFVPMGTPEQKVEQLTTAVRASIRTRPVMDAMAEVAMAPMDVSTDSYATVLEKERAAWKTIVARHNDLTDAPTTRGDTRNE